MTKQSTLNKIRISLKAGVSQSTVQRYFRGENISKGNIALIEGACSKLRVPNRGDLTNIIQSVHGAAVRS